MTNNQVNIEELIKKVKTEIKVLERGHEKQKKELEASYKKQKKELEANFQKWWQRLDEEKKKLRAKLLDELASTPQNVAQAEPSSTCHTWNSKLYGLNSTLKTVLVRKDVTTAMLNHLRKTVDETMKDLTFESLRSLLKNEWTSIFNGPIYLGSTCVHDLIHSRLDQNDTYLGFICLNLNSKHQLDGLYTRALTRRLPEVTSSEIEYHNFCDGFVNDVFDTMNSIDHGKLFVNLTALSDQQVELAGSASAHSLDSSSRSSTKSNSSNSSTKTSTVDTRPKQDDKSGLSKPSSKKYLKRRPDIVVKDANENIHFLCEIKKSKKLHDRAANQCLTMTLPLNDKRVHRSFVATLVQYSFELEYVVIEGGVFKRHPLSSYLLSNPGDRLRLVTNMITLYALIGAHVEQIKLDKYNYFPVIERPTCKLQYLDSENTVLKYVQLDPLVKKFSLQDHLVTLERFYKLIDENNNPCPIHNSLRSVGSVQRIIGDGDRVDALLVALKPIGFCLAKTTTSGQIEIEAHVEQNWRKFLADVVAFLNSLHARGFIHNDVRIFNVVCTDLDTPTYCVIDYENIRPICPARCQVHHKSGHASVKKDFDMLREMVEALQLSATEKKEANKIIPTRR